MHFIFGICQWLEQTMVGTTIRESLWLFPIIETVHIFGVILLVGSTSILDLRLMGLAFRDEPVSKLAQRFLPWAWAGFLTQVTTGLLLFSPEATNMYRGPLDLLRVVKNSAVNERGDFPLHCGETLASSSASTGRRWPPTSAA